MISAGTARSVARHHRQSREDVIKVVDAIRAIIQSLRISGRAIEQELGISSAQLYVLQALDEQPAQSINDLAYNTFTHQSSASMVVSRLVDKALVRRLPSQGDGRRASISLTAAGRSVVRRAPFTAQSRLMEGLRTFRRSELRALGDYLETVAELVNDQRADDQERDESRGRA